MAPAATLATVGVTWAARCRGSTTPGHPRALGRAQQGTDVVRIGHAVEHEQERRCHSARSSHRARARPPRGAGRGRGRPGGRRCAPLCRAWSAGRARAGPVAVSPVVRCRRSAGTGRDPRTPTPLARDGGRAAEQLAHGLATLDLLPTQAVPARAGTSGHAPRPAPAPAPGPVPTVRSRRDLRRRPTSGRFVPTSGGLGAAGRAAAAASRWATARPGRWRGGRRRTASTAGWTAHATPARSTTARQAMPSTRPIAPRPSARLAFTLTGAPSRSCEPARHVVGVLGQPGSLAHDGAVRIHEPHVPALPPSTTPGPAAPWSRRRPKSGSLAGKWRPRSPSPAAPSSASATAWATTSASLWPASPAAPGIGHAPEHERPARVPRETVHVESLPDAHRDRHHSGRRSCHRQRLGHLEVGGRGDLDVARLAGHDAHGSAQRLHQARRRRWHRTRVRGRDAAHRREKPGASAPPRCPSRCHRGDDAVVLNALQRVGHGNPGTAASAPPRHRVDHGPENAGDARGRAPSWTTITSAESGTAASPARTDAARDVTARPPRRRLRRRPPTAHRGHRRRRSRHRRRGRRARRRRPRPAMRRAAHCTMGRPPSRANCLGAPNRSRCRPPPRPPTPTRAHLPFGGPRPAGAARARAGQGSASSRRFSAAASSTSRAKVSSDTRIWRARLSMRFSPADRPLSLSRMDRFRTTSATW